MAQIGETELDIRALSWALWRRAWLPLLLAVAAAFATYVALGYVEPLYTADTSILIEERESPLTRPRDSAEPRADFDEPAIQSQVEVIRSREIAEAVIDKLDLTHRPEFDPATRPSLVTSLLVMLGLKEHPADASIRQRVMDSYFERLSVYALARSRVIGISFQAPDPQLAAEVANAIADTFVEMQQQAQRESAMAATAWLEQEIERLRRRVAEAEQAIAEFRTSNELFSSGELGNLSQQQLSDLNAELARARAARAEAEARAALIESLLSDGGALEASEEVLSSALIQRLRERQVALRAQIAELSTTLLPGHPRIRAMQGQLANLEAQILQEAERVLTSLHTAARVAAAREESLLESLNQAMAEVSRSNVQEIELRALEREAAAQRDLLETFLGRYREAAARTDADYLPADARIISRAVAPQEPSYPKKAMMAVVVAIATFLIVVAVLLLREFTSGRAFRVMTFGMPTAATTAGPPDADGADFVSIGKVEMRPEPESRLPLTPAREPLRKFEPPPAPVFEPAVESEFQTALEEDFENEAEAEIEPWAEAEFEVWPEDAPEPVSERDFRSYAELRAAEAEAIPEPPIEAEPEFWPEDPAEPAPQRELHAEARIVEAEETVLAAPIGADPEPADAEPESSVEATEDEEDRAAGELQPEPEPEPAAPAEPDPIAAADPQPAVKPEPTLAVEPALAVAEIADTVEAREADLQAFVPIEAEAGVAAAVPALAEDKEPDRGPPPAPAAQKDPPGTAELAEIVAGEAVRVALFTGAEGGEGAGEVAYATARQVVREKLRCVIVDVGARPSAALGTPGEPGLGDLLAGEFSFGEVIRRDEVSRVHVIPLGTAKSPPLQRLQLVIGALTHTYDKVIVVADSIADWPEEQLRPDLAAIVCGPRTTEFLRTEVYEEALRRGARSAIIVRFASDGDSDGLEASAAA